MKKKTNNPKTKAGKKLVLDSSLRELRRAASSFSSGLPSQVLISAPSVPVISSSSSLSTSGGPLSIAREFSRFRQWVDESLELCKSSGGLEQLSFALLLACFGELLLEDEIEEAHTREEKNSRDSGAAAGGGKKILATRSSKVTSSKASLNRQGGGGGRGDTMKTNVTPQSSRPVRKGAARVYVYEDEDEEDEDEEDNEGDEEEEDEDGDGKTKDGEDDDEEDGDDDEEDDEGGEHDQTTPSTLDDGYSIGPPRPFLVARALLLAHRASFDHLIGSSEIIASLLLITDPVRQVLGEKRTRKARLAVLESACGGGVGGGGIPSSSSSSSSSFKPSPLLSHSLLQVGADVIPPTLSIEGNLLWRLLDPQRRLHVFLSQLSLQLCLEYFMRSGSSFLLGRLNDRITVSVIDEKSHYSRFQNNVSTSLASSSSLFSGPMSLPVLDVLTGISRAADTLSSLPPPPSSPPPSTSLTSPEVSIFNSSRVLQWGVPFASSNCYNGNMLRTDVPWPDYRASAFGRAILSASVSSSPLYSSLSSSTTSSSTSSIQPTLPTRLVTSLIEDSGDSLFSCTVAPAFPVPKNNQKHVNNNNTSTLDGYKIRYSRCIICGFCDGVLRIFLSLVILPPFVVGENMNTNTQGNPPPPPPSQLSDGTSNERERGISLSLSLHTPRSVSSSNSSITCSAISTCREYLLSGHADGTLRLWHLSKFVSIAIRKAVHDSSSSSSTRGGSVSIEMELSSALLTITSGHSGMPVWACAFNPLSPSVFSSGGRDGCAYLWSSSSPTSPQRIFAGHSSDISSLIFHPNGLYLITASADGSSRLFDCPSGDCLRAYSSNHVATNSKGRGGGGGGTVRLGCLAISPSGFVLAAGDDAGRVFLWEVGTGHLVHVWTGHGKGRGREGGASVDCIAFSIDGRILASAATLIHCDIGSDGIDNDNVDDDNRNHNQNDNGSSSSMSQSHDNSTIISTIAASHQVKGNDGNNRGSSSSSSSSSSTSSSSSSSSSSTLCLWNIEAVVNAVKASSFQGGAASGSTSMITGGKSSTSTMPITASRVVGGLIGLLSTYSLKSTTAHALIFEEDEGLVLVGTKK